MKTLFAIALLLSFYGFWLHGYKSAELEKIKDCSHKHLDKKATLDIIEQRLEMYQTMVNEVDSLRSLHRSSTGVSTYKWRTEVKTDTILIKL